MEEPINVRYTFMMLLAISDPKGYVVGTDIAIARRLNIKLSELQECLAVLLAPDPNSNSQESEGRRLVPSDTDRGYKLVNYLTYREMTSTENRRAYMREYMRAKRKTEKATDGDVKQSANNVKHVAALGQEEADAEEEEKPEEEALPTANAADAEVDEFADPLPPSEAELFADWFKTLLPDTVRLSKTWRAEWAKVYDKLVRIDKRTPLEIRQICQWARSDNFWGSNFMTPAKLRQRNNSQILYYDVFAQQQKRSANSKIPESRRAVQEGRCGGGPTSVPTERFTA